MTHEIAPTQRCPEGYRAHGSWRTSLKALAWPLAWMRDRIRRIALVCVIGQTLLGGPAAARSWAGLVVHVTDGDTLWVQPDHGGDARKLRLAGIDAPERCQLWGLQAWGALQARLHGQHVQVEAGRLDTYGRWLARVWHQGQDVSAWMVVQGHAWSPYFRGMPGPYDSLQREAQWSRRGMFAHPLGLMPPREFRRWHGSC